MAVWTVRTAVLRADLYALGIEDVTSPELEAAIEMTREALVHLGLYADDIQRVTTTMRRERYRNS
jgi:hypothetical protein